MNKGIKSFLGWGEMALAILIASNQAFGWAGWLEYLWAVLLLGAGIWILAAKNK